RAGHSTSAPVEVDVAELLGGRADAWSAFAGERQVHVEAMADGAVVARATPGRLEQGVDNLLNNAPEVAPAGSRVTLAATTKGSWVERGVVDEARGMSPDDRWRAFDRFWQTGASRRDGRTVGHFGLGLPIVRELVVGDGGEVSLENSVSGGLE